MQYNIRSFAEERLKAPDFPRGKSWINTHRPLTMKELRGRVVLLDFWTYCCINCMHVIPDLKKLEKRYGDMLAVVGVHSAKFTGEKDTDNIRDAVLRYGIEHPVVNDSDFDMWMQMGVRAWPTFVLIDQEGYIVGQVSGEGNYETLDKAINALLLKKPPGETGLQPLPLKREVPQRGASELYYPGKILFSPKTGILFIADSGNNRIVMAESKTGEVMDIVGSGAEGMKNGSWEEASFNNPQGMAFRENILLIADTDNHALRAVDLSSRTVSTVTGDGVKAGWMEKGGNFPNARMNSPWDMVFLKKILYIAMAGNHQIWYCNFDTEYTGLYAGSGREDIIDGDLRTSAFAQSSGITTDGTNLYIADSETSSIRLISVEEGKVKTISGKGLFVFGHRDGLLEEALFQHPLGVKWTEGGLYVADTYNNMIRKIDNSQKTVNTIAGAQEDGLADGKGGKAGFDEPGGIEAVEGRLYVADTNNHAVRVLDLSNFEVSTLAIAKVLLLPEDDSLFEVEVLPPEGYSVNLGSPSEITAVLSSGEIIPVSAKISSESLHASFAFPMKPGGVVEFHGVLYLCREGEHSVCEKQDFSFTRIIRKSPYADVFPEIQYRVNKN